MAEIDQTKLWYQPNLDVFLNQWFADYDAARAALDSEGGFLLPYQKHFFVCRADVIQALGLDPNDSDWEKIGRDCARPSDTEAFQRLRQKRERIVREAMGD
jgi:hypothetical protein